jgi:hypothetical protein
VTTIFPGTTATQRQINLHEISGKRYDPDRMLQPEDVAEAVLFALTIGRTAEIPAAHAQTSGLEKARCPAVNALD